MSLFFNAVLILLFSFGIFLNSPRFMSVPAITIQVLWVIILVLFVTILVRIFRAKSRRIRWITVGMLLVAVSFAVYLGPMSEPESIDTHYYIFYSEEDPSS